MVRSARAETFSDDDLTRGYHALAGGFDELVERSGTHQAALGAAAARARRAQPGHPLAAHRAAQRAGAGNRASRTICSPIRRARPSPGASISCPLVVAPEEWRHAGARPDPAGEAVRGHPGGPLRPAAAAGVGRHPASARVQRPLLPAALSWPQAARRPHPVLRHRSGARPGRALAHHRHAHGDARPASAMRSPTAWCTPTSPATSSAPARRCGWRRSSSSCRARWPVAPIAPTPPSPC